MTNKTVPIRQHDYRIISKRQDKFSGYIFIAILRVHSSTSREHLAMTLQTPHVTLSLSLSLSLCGTKTALSSKCLFPPPCICSQQTPLKLANKHSRSHTQSFCLSTAATPLPLSVVFFTQSSNGERKKRRKRAFKDRNNGFRKQRQQQHKGGFCFHVFSFVTTSKQVISLKRK